MRSSIFFILILFLISGTVGTSTISGYSNCDTAHISLEHWSEESTHIMRFGTTNGSYQSNIASHSSTTLGASGYSISARAGQTYTGDIEIETLGLMIAEDNAGIHSDQTNAPETICEANNIASNSLLESDGNNTTKISGKFPTTQDALATVMMRGAGDGVENSAKYTSATSISGNDFSLQHTSDAYAGGSNIETLRASILSGHNNTAKIPQYREFTDYHTVSYSNETAGLSAGSIINFTGHSYKGGNSLIGWEPETDNDEVVNNTSSEEV